MRGRFRRAAALAMIVGASVGTRPAFGENPAAPEAGTRLSAQLGSAALAGGLPSLALGSGMLLERGYFGVEAAAHIGFPIVCGAAGGGDLNCPTLWILDVAPRVTPAPGERSSPYLAARAQAVGTTRDGFDYAIGPRLGFRHRPNRLGFFVELGGSYLFRDEGNNLTFFQASAGMIFGLR